MQVGDACTARCHAGYIVNAAYIHQPMTYHCMNDGNIYVSDMACYALPGTPEGSTPNITAPYRCLTCMHVHPNPSLRSQHLDPMVSVGEANCDARAYCVARECPQPSGFSDQTLNFLDPWVN
jgi:hypothetical protein